MKRVHVALNPPRTVHEFAAFARAVASCLSEDRLFSPPKGLLVTLERGVVALEAALAAALTRRLGAAAARKARQRDVLATLQQLQAYVQSIANTLPLEEAAMVAKRAGMDVKDVKGPSKGALTVKAGPVSGSVHAYVKAAKARARYEWHVSSDGETWEPREITMRADVTLGGFVPGQWRWVRARAVTTAGPTDWLGPVRVLVA